ncbi:MAG: peptidoglycan-binding protein LysM [Acidiferrobacterales bacterium]|nr:peptidoglycan-binding protein LysM [Acidiferrobacterales bacterium]
MGLFDFAADIGKKVFGIGDANAADQIKENIEANNPGVSDLTVSLDDEVCTITGNCETPEAKDKTVLMTGNMKGVGSVNADGLNAPAAAVEPEYYVIQKGDTLWAIAAKFLGNGSKYPEIFEANREVIEDPDKIFVGQKIIIPK